MSNNSIIESILKSILSDNFQTNVDLSQYSSLKIGGKADYFAQPENEVEFSRLIKFLNKHKIPWLVIGCGTNLLFDDKGFRGVIIKLSKSFSYYQIDGEEVIAGSAVWIPKLAKAMGNHGLSGIEHTIGIPCSLGGLIVMNGGSQRRNISENIISVRIINKNGIVEDIPKSECGFNYRTSKFQESKEIILGAKFNFAKGNKSKIIKEMLDILKTRNKKFPRKLNNCGSVFKSDEALYNAYGPPGKLIESLNLKGENRGDIFVSEMHANFFVNKANGLSEDFINLVNYVRNKVYEKIGYMLETEVRYITETGQVDFLDKFL